MRKKPNRRYLFGVREKPLALPTPVSIIATGRAAETFSAPNDPEEWRKKITTQFCL
jgi:hypothetical protein